MSERLSHVHLDPLGGASGDMFISALLDAWPEAWDGMERAIRAAGLPGDWQLEVTAGRDGPLTGSRFAVRPPEGGKLRPSGRFADIAAMLESAALDDGPRGHALAILTLLAEAEAEVHGIPLAEVHFHEIADWDSLADVVGAGFLIDWLGDATWSAAPLPLGRGRIETAHGALPVPAPATAKLLRGLAVFDDGIGGERVTPTGAAILKHLSPAAMAPSVPLALAAEGTGFGTRKLPGIANALRVLGFRDPDDARRHERVAVLSFEVDDQTPEDLAVGLERLRGLPGVLDVLQLPAFGKKGRMLASVRLLARPDAAGSAIEACFRETTTIGLRWGLTERVALQRREASVTDELGVQQVKVVDRPGKRTAKAEIDGVASDQTGHASRQARRRRAESRVLDEDGR